jgi:predicted amidohydrolase YtcJ
MLKIFSKIFISGLLLSMFFGCTSEENQADQIFINGTIYTVDDQAPVVPALAVKHGKILAVGSNQEIEKLKGGKTQVIDLQDKMMMPGFIEGHAHFMGLGYAKLDLDLMAISSYEELIQKVKEKVETSEPGEWIIGRGWHQDKWDSISKPIVQGFPTHHALSLVSPDNPVFLKHASGHAALANAKAMEIAGIDASTQFDEGGAVFKDAAGKPTGIFNETAQYLIGKHIPESDEKRSQQAFDLAVQTCLENGITSFHDAGAGPDVIALYKKNLETGNLKMRLYGMLDGSNSELLKTYFASGPEVGLGNDFLTIRSIKLYSDGALGSRGAWLLEEYEDMHGEFGHSTTPIEEIFEVCEEAIKYGFQVGTHAIGDRANHEVLNKYESAFRASDKPSADFRFRIEHAQHLHPDDIPRFSELGIIPAMQAIHMSSDRPWAIDRLGEKRIIAGAYVWQDLLKSGAQIVNGTDAPVEPVNPIPSFYASVTRKTLKGQPPGGYEPAQKMTREQALKSYTLDAAYGAFEEDIKGSIEVGKYADFAVLDQDIMKIPEDQILTSKVLMTIVNGHVVYSDGSILPVE